MAEVTSESAKLSIARVARSHLLRSAGLRVVHGRWSRRLAPLLVRFAGVQHGDTVLDVGSGIGALTAAVAERPRRAASSASIRRRCTWLSRNPTRQRAIPFEVGDAQQIHFDNVMFDRTLALLVLNFIPDGARRLAK